MSELLGEMTDRKATLKRLIREIHQGVDPERAKRESADLLRTLTATEIAQTEGEMIEEGFPREEIERLCDVHLMVFQESLQGEQAEAGAGHPIQILMKEHELILELSAQLVDTARQIASATDRDAASPTVGRLRAIAQQFEASGNHYLREENVLFPYLEKHGIVEPPAMMWREHDKIRVLKKELYALVREADSTPAGRLGKRLGNVAEQLAAMLESHFFKENNVLFPAALQVMTEEEWASTTRQFGEIGYWKVLPSGVSTASERIESARTQVDGVIPFSIGTILLDALEPILNALPVDLTFVDDQDTVRYFSQTRERIFPRTAAIIGRKVQQCHPEKSVHVVNQILDDFRNNRRDSAEFWIQSNGHFIVIRYYAVRRDGHYLGCVEVTQDATDIRALQGEKRLL